MRAEHTPPAATSPLRSPPLHAQRRQACLAASLYTLCGIKGEAGEMVGGEFGGWWLLGLGYWHGGASGEELGRPQHHGGELELFTPANGLFGGRVVGFGWMRLRNRPQ